MSHVFCGDFSKKSANAYTRLWQHWTQKQQNLTTEMIVIILSNLSIH